MIDVPRALELERALVHVVRDRTVHASDAALPAGERINLVVRREPIPEGKSARDRVAQHLRREAGAREGFAVISQEEAANDVRARFRDAGRVLYEPQAHLALSAMTSPLAARERCDELLDHVLASLRLRDAS